MLNLLVEPIRLDLQVSDTQISFLQGLAFAVTYILMSVPLGRMVDKYNRVGIMIGGVLGVECDDNCLRALKNLLPAAVCKVWGWCGGGRA